ncbi:AAA family ATPase [Alloalcanivorax xenomutans]|jgi:ATP-dependent Clp protease ATP-binding subunit ClpA|uniref:AAA family ATPase n=2 Tax=Alloalcanivorax xenomutans TaxID=1094342 RepID=UPI0003B81A76|nr:AAA family ATPase [Alloalcanivorax xenomutans]ERS12777.1 ATPase AAA [Alcanivorax sp. PN-3]MBA4722760.1 ATP-dependent Clp protease ATP-binding subunit [Alcanivorax sp.]MCE7521849.1 AAA family ATPase [Alloalcanivorax xenomutans]PHS60271.1 MAG: ATP-dependent Clp protease ATP-binding subunit [Alcanivorax sp.]CUR46510.1 ClpB protein [Alloalcanivorax xenomutans]
MPFLNDMIEQNQRQRDQHLALNHENAARHNVVQAHLRHQSALQSRYRFDVSTIMATLRGEILGQDPALQAVEDILKVVRADITDPRRPLFTALFLGPTGVGKTEIVRALARALHGDADAFCRVDMNTLSQEHYAAALTGAPPGYVGAKEGTTLLDQDKLEGTQGRPGIVLFDELEKASDEVIQALLNVFDNGMLTVASGERTYSFRNTLIFMTSNLGARDIQHYDERRARFPRSLLPGGHDRRHHHIDKLVRGKLLKAFSPEFVNRIDTTITFNWIEPDIVEQLVALEISRLNQRLIKHHCHLDVDPKVVSFLARQGFDRQFGARSLRRGVRRYLEVPLAEYLLRHHHPCDNGDTPTAYWARLEHQRVVFLPL